jgi:hypothetical protein
MVSNDGVTAGWQIPEHGFKRTSFGWQGQSLAAMGFLAETFGLVEQHQLDLAVCAAYALHLDSKLRRKGWRGESEQKKSG